MGPALQWLILLLIIVGGARKVLANHENCTTVSCADLCNFQGTWITTNNATTSSHGYCVCNDMYYTLEQHDYDSTHHTTDINNNCATRRKSQLTAVTLHVLFAPFAASHWYLEHTVIAIFQMIFGIGACISLYLLVWTEDLKFCVKVVAIGCLSIFLFWAFVDLLLFIRNNHFKDINGEELYAW